MKTKIPVLIGVFIIGALLFSNPLEGQIITDSHFECNPHEGMEHIHPITLPANLFRTFPEMSWPLGNDLYDDLFLMNYFDESNPFSTDGMFVDYECGNVLGYDGHTGTDITVFNFRLMDVGMPIYAAAGGLVEITRWDEYDRHYEPPYSSNIPNVVLIRHVDGSATLYVHLRTESVGVEVGEEIQKGQLLGYVGSSGSSPMPHLHIEFWEIGSTSYPNVTFRDPWEGICNDEYSLWEEQLDYVPTNPIWIMDAGVTTEIGAGGDAQNLFSRPFKDRAPQPIIWGADEPYMIAWVQLQSPIGSNYQIDIIRPNGSIFKTSGLININSYIRYSWHPFVWETTSIPYSQFGDWIMRITTNGEVAREIPFEVGASTYYAPRFYPLAGKSIRLNGEPRIEASEIWEYAESVDLHLINAPNYVNLAGNQVVINAPNNQPFRNEWFQLVATDVQNFTDTMWYHIVDSTKPLAPVVSSVEEINPANFFIFELSPNPADERSLLSIVGQPFLENNIEIFHVSGTLISNIKVMGNSAGEVKLNMKSLIGKANIPDGIYFIRAQQNGQSKTIKFIWNQ